MDYLVIAARDLRRDDVLLSNGATVNLVEKTVQPGVIFVEVDYTYRLTFSHGDPVKVYRPIGAAEGNNR